MLLRFSDVDASASDGIRVYVEGDAGKVLALRLTDGTLVWTLVLTGHTAPDVKLFSSSTLAHGRL